MDPAPPRHAARRARAAGLDARGGSRAGPRRRARARDAQALARAPLPSGAAESFAYSQYALGHACDQSARWLSSHEPFLTDYAFGCEPYLLYNRRAAPRLWEMFVAYGKDRVSFTYELAARGFVFVVQPDAFVVHHRTPVAPSQQGRAYGHEPEAWMVGESCWPDFENRVRIKYRYRAGWCTQSGIGRDVNFSIVNDSVVCVAQAENLCVLNCRPAVARWQGAKVAAMRRAHRTALMSGGGGGGGGFGNASSGGGGDWAGAATDDSPSIHFSGTPTRPPKAASVFTYPLSRRDADRRECCMREPAAAQCDEWERAAADNPAGG